MATKSATFLAKPFVGLVLPQGFRTILGKRSSQQDLSRPKTGVGEMESDIIFLVDEHAGLLPMRNESYKSEAMLQAIVADFPQVLTGGYSGATSRLALVKREKPVADSDRGAGRWSLDHLFLDQDGIPTLVEVKRSTDTRIRREVVGQMLDYAANGVKYWPVDDLREEFALTHANAGPDQVLADLVGAEVDPEAFWSMVSDNLAAGRIRMVFLADEIPADLRRIIEFLNEQMTRTEVVAVEVKQYVGSGRQILVPRLLGATSRAQQAKRTGPKLSYPEILEAAPPVLRELENRIVEWAQKHGYQVQQKPAALGVAIEDGPPLLQFYPGAGQIVEMYLGHIREAKLAGGADWVQENCSELVGKRLTAQSPNIPAVALAANWDRFESEILPVYVDLSLKAWGLRSRA